MTKLILPSRRRFLFMAPAIVTASSLMKGHSIAKLLTPTSFPTPRAWGLIPLIPAIIDTSSNISEEDINKFIDEFLAQPLPWDVMSEKKRK